MQHRIGRLLEWLGGGYLAILFVLFMYGYVVLAADQGAWVAIARLREEWSPFAVFDHAIRLVLAAPGLGLLYLGIKLRSKSNTEGPGPL